MPGPDNPIDQFGSPNRQAFDRLVQAIASRCAVALVGAGLSARLGYPAWDRLIELLEERADALNCADASSLSAVRHMDDKLVAAGKLKALLGPARFEEFV